MEYFIKKEYCQYNRYKVIKIYRTHCCPDGTPTKRQVAKRPVSKRPVSKRQVYKIRFTKRQVSKRLVSKRPVHFACKHGCNKPADFHQPQVQKIYGCFFATGRFEDLTFCKPDIL
jgi:hypothetical protein